MNPQSYEEFTTTTLNRKGKRKAKISNSYGVQDYYNHYRHLYKDARHKVSYQEYAKVINSLNQSLAKRLINVGMVDLPLNCGRISINTVPIRYKETKKGFTNTAGIDWQKTLKLWYEDHREFENKTLVKFDIKERFAVRYNRYNTAMINSMYFMFKLHRNVIQEINTLFKNNKLNINGYGKEEC
jgi:hypothetical protein